MKRDISRYLLYLDFPHHLKAILLYVNFAKRVIYLDPTYMLCPFFRRFKALQHKSSTLMPLSTVSNNVVSRRSSSRKCFSASFHVRAAHPRRFAPFRVRISAGLLATGYACRGKRASILRSTILLGFRSREKTIPRHEDYSYEKSTVSVTRTILSYRAI